MLKLTIRKHKLFGIDLEDIVYDIVEILETMGSISGCDKSRVMSTSYLVFEMIKLSINALQNKEAVSKLYNTDNS